MPPSQVLNCNLQIFIKADWIQYVPPVKAEPLLRLIGPIGFYDLMQACIGRIVYGIISLTIEIIGSAKVIFSSSSIYCWKLTITIHEELYFTFAPPAIVVYSPGHI